MAGAKAVWMAGQHPEPEMIPLLSGDDAQLGDGRGNGSSCFLYTLTALSAIGGFLFGYDTGVIGGAMLILREDWTDFTDQQQTLVVVATMAGCIVAVLVAGPATERFGRQPVILAGSLIFAVGAGLMAVAPDIKALVVGRFVVGVAVGLASMAIPMYIAEVAPPESRGALVTVNNVFITGGQFIACVVDALLSCVDYPRGWRLMLGLGAVPALVQFVGFLFLPESPRWLGAHRGEQAAWQALVAIRGSRRGGVAAKAVQDELRQIMVGVREEASQKQVGFLAACSSPPLRRAMYLGCMLQLIQQLSGINTVMYYCPTIFKLAGYTDATTAIWLTAGVAAVGWVCCMAAVPIVDKVGRRALTLSSLGGVILALGALGGAFSYLHTSSPSCLPLPAAADVLGPGMASSSQCAASDYAACDAHTRCFDCVIAPCCGFCQPAADSTTTTATAARGYCMAGNQSGPFVAWGGCSMADRRVDDEPDTCRQANEQGLVSSGSWGALERSSNGTWSHASCPSSNHLGGWWALIAAGAYVAMFQPGMGPMPWTINAEIYPLHARSMAVSLATLVNWSSNLLVAATFLDLVEWLTPQGAFWTYAAIGALGWAWLYVFLPETAGKSLEEIEQLFGSSVKVVGSGKVVN